MRDRNLPSTLATLKSSASRVVFGLPPHEPDAASFIETILHWSRTDDEKPFRLALRRNPELVCFINGSLLGLFMLAALLLKSSNEVNRCHIGLPFLLYISAT